MKKIAKLLFLFVFTTVILSGCGAKNTSAGYRAVTQVDVVTRYAHTLIRRHYTDPEKMEAVLIHLRILKSLGTPETDPENAKDDVFLIAVQLSDGTIHYYRQAAHRYLSREDEGWIAVPPVQAARLYGILSHFPSDPYPKITK